jgi:DNA-directed RNA polymerase specialized sigma24 family protein
MTDPEGDADDALDRAGEKIREGSTIPEIARFCIGIARNIIKERLREQRRRESAARKLIEEIQNQDTEALEERMALMKQCFEKLSAEDQQLLIEYCKVPPGLELAEHRRKLAERHNSSIGALRIRIARLRRRLEDCVKDLKKRR